MQLYILIHQMNFRLYLYFLNSYLFSSSTLVLTVSIDNCTHVIVFILSIIVIIIIIISSALGKNDVKRQQDRFESDSTTIAMPKLSCSNYCNPGVSIHVFVHLCLPVYWNNYNTNRRSVRNEQLWVASSRRSVVSSQIRQEKCASFDPVTGLRQYRKSSTKCQLFGWNKCKSHTSKHDKENSPSH